jgi:signal transduction histidine kinase
MLSEILFVLLVLAVAVLMAVDLVRTRGESQHGHADRQAHSSEPAVAAALSRGPAARTFSPEPARAMPAVPAPAAGPSARETEATRAFDQMHREMARSAANETELREKLNAIFVNLSHRSQSLVERQLRLIEDLEHGEQDAQRRANLSKLNRIAMRMHRNSQNLLVIAGHQPSPGWNQPVTLAHLVNAALAEVEDYERVSSEVQPDIAVRGPAVNDLVHLLVELIENATSFSAAEMPVHIKGHILTSGGALVEITDRGIGMTAKEMAYANQQLDNPPAADTDVPRWMGLLVVARLAARHGIRVRLNQAELGGLTALVWLPDEILTHYSAAADPGRAAEQRGAAVGPAAYVSARMSTQDALATRPDPAWSARGGAQATVPAESAAAVRFSASGRTDVPGGDVGVVMPQADGHSRTRGLPIFDEVESRWSRGGRDAPGSAGLAAASGAAGLAAAPGPAGLAAAPGSAASALPRRPSPTSAGPRAVPGTPPSTPNRSGLPGRKGSAAPDKNPGGQDES